MKLHAGKVHVNLTQTGAKQVKRKASKTLAS